MIRPEREFVRITVHVLPRHVDKWEGDLNKARDIHYALFEINQAVFYDTNPIPIKYMMKKVGLIPENEHRLPMVPALPELERRLDGVLERAGMV